MSLIGDALDEAMLEEKLEDLDIEFTIESIREQLNNLLDNSNKRNYLKKFQSKFDRLEDVDENLRNERDSLYDEILDSIADTFGFEIYKEDINLQKASKYLYKFFVVELLDNIVYFLECYILEHKDEIVDYLKKTESVISKKIEGLDSSMSLVLNNMTDVINYIYDMDVEFEYFLKILDKHPDAPASVSEISKYNENIINDDELNVVMSILQPIINESEGFSRIYTNLQMNLYKRFVD